MCKQLGYESGVKYTAPGGTGSIVAGNRICAGGEATVYDCPLKRKSDSFDCTHHIDQGVQCEGGKGKNESYLIIATMLPAMSIFLQLAKVI